jgi:Fe-S oxidoreductase
MAGKKPPKIEDLLEKRLYAATGEDLERARAGFRAKLGRDEAALLNSCIHCGLCAEACHYYLSDPQPENLPAYKLGLVIKVFKRYFTPSGRLAPGWVGAKDLDADRVREWIDALYGRCSLCGRCSLSCTMGIGISSLIRTARGLLTSLDLVPSGLDSTVKTAVEKGNNMGIDREDWVETVDWLSEELRTETGDPEASLPMDKTGARVLYTVNPREPKFFPLSLLAAAKIFHAAGESWTLSSADFDATNYGLYSGDDEVSALLSGRLLKTAVALGAEALILPECGHGFNSNRWEAPEWIGRAHPVDVRSILEVTVDYVKQGRIRLDPTRNPKRTTLHDPCNLVRLGGVAEEQRWLLKRSVSDFVEMTPNREKNYCCGGGGGQLSMTAFADRRIKAGGIKAEQIRKTGAQVVATPCHNCIDQLLELNKFYKLGVEIRTVSEIVADALILDAPDRRD